MIHLIGPQALEDLRREAWASEKKRAHLLLHGPNDRVTECIVALHATSYVRPHRHPQPESYHVIEGELHSYIYNDAGENTMRVRLNAEAPMYRLAAGVFHQPVAHSGWAVYHEVYPGPFVKHLDVEYAPWAVKEVA